MPSVLPATAPSEHGAAQWLGSVAAALLANWVCLRLTATSFLLLNVLGLCREGSFGACVALTSLAPALLLTFAFATAVFALRVAGFLRGWRRRGVLLALLGFVAGGVWQGILAAKGAQTSQPVGELTSPLEALQPWLPCLLSSAVLSSWVAWRKLVSLRRAAA